MKKTVDREEVHAFITLALGLLAHFNEHREEEEYFNSAGHILHDFRHYLETGERRSLMLPDEMIDVINSKLQ